MHARRPRSAVAGCTRAAPGRPGPGARAAPAVARGRPPPPVGRGLAHGQQSTRVGDGHRLDLGVADAGLAEPRQERPREVRVAVALVARRAASRGRRPGTAGSARRGRVRAARTAARHRAGLAVSLRGRERHPEEVELDVRAALDDREVVVEDRVRVGVADDDPRRVRRPPPRRSGAGRARPATGRRGS